MCLAEMGDKTQLLVMAMTARFKMHDIIAGVVLAVIMLNLTAVAAGTALSFLVPMEWVRLAAGLSFLAFAVWTLRGEEDDEQEEGRRRKGSIPAFLVIAGSFFIAEMGDKTQLYTVSLAAADPGNAAYILAGSVVGLLAADAAGVACGLLLGRSVPKDVINLLSFAVFAVFGLVTVYSPLGLVAGGLKNVIFAVIFAVFAGVCLYTAARTRQKSGAREQRR